MKIYPENYKKDIEEIKYPGNNHKKRKIISKKCKKYISRKQINKLKERKYPESNHKMTKNHQKRK